jgi:hypothetical protein
MQYFSKVWTNVVYAMQTGLNSLDRVGRTDSSMHKIYLSFGHPSSLVILLILKNSGQNVITSDLDRFSATHFIFRTGLMENIVWKSKLAGSIPIPSIFHTQWLSHPNLIAACFCHFSPANVGITT